jgi:hypothetical protein
MNNSDKQIQQGYRFKKAMCSKKLYVFLVNIGTDYHTRKEVPQKKN